MKQPSPPLLNISASTGSPSGYHTGGAPTGRPPLWTKSAQRKMTRLYVYTTLPINKIISVIYAHSPDSAPGTDSANKKLNALFDKEPRWLRPRSENEVGQRLEQLSNSPTRLRAARNSNMPSPPAPTMFDFEQPPHASYSGGLPLPSTLIKAEPGASPSTLDSPALYSGPSSAASTPAFQSTWARDSLDFAAGHLDRGKSAVLASPADTQSSRGGSSRNPASSSSNSAFDPFLRQTTFMSTSSTDSTGSLQHILNEYSQPYVQAVKRLVRRFTAPAPAPVPDLRSTTPTSDLGSGPAAVQSWLDVSGSPPAGLRGRPYPLPGDFLQLDLAPVEGDCDPASAHHVQRRCLCHARLDDFFAPWVTPEGLTPRALRLLGGSLPRTDVGVTDAFGNTMLHLLAARGSLNSLFHALQSGHCGAILHVRNSARQTLLHVVSRAWIQNVDHLCRLLQMLVGMEFDLASVDCYGRSFVHMLWLQGMASSDVARVLRFCDPSMLRRRDAFGATALGRLSSPAVAALDDNDDGDGFQQQQEYPDYYYQQQQQQHHHHHHQSVETTHMMDIDSPPRQPTASDGLDAAARLSLSPDSRDDPIVARESQLLRNVREALQNPGFEDAEGRNGLHCLALATLSMKSVVDKSHLASPRALSPLEKPAPQQKRTVAKERGTGGSGSSSNTTATTKSIGKSTRSAGGSGGGKGKSSGGGDNDTDTRGKHDSSKDRMNLRLGLVTALLDAGVDPNHYDVHGTTPLMAFAGELPEDDDYKVGPQILATLMARGANVNARSRAGETALHVAVRRGRKLAVKSLVTKRANVHARDAAGRGLLDVADARLLCVDGDNTREYAHLEACRAWLSSRGRAVQDPSVSHEWAAH